MNQKISPIFLSLLWSIAGLGALGGDVLAQTDSANRTPGNQLSVKLLESLQSPEKTYGWKTSEENGKLEFVVQLSPKSLTAEKGGDAKKSGATFVRQAFLLDVPKNVLGRFEVVVVSIGEAILPRESLSQHSDLTNIQRVGTQDTFKADQMRKIVAENSSGELGWLPDASGRNLQGIAQLSPTMCEFMLSSQKEFASIPPSAVANKLTQIAIIIGTGPFPVEPVTIEATDASESQPRSSTIAADGADAVDALKRQYNEREQQARQLAAKLQLGTTITDSQKQELEKAVRESFAAAQALQRAELARRLQIMQQAIDARERRADEIVARRVEELLNPILQWEQASETR